MLMVRDEQVEGATLRDRILAAVKNAPEGVDRSQLDRDERTVATLLANEHLIVKRKVDNRVAYFSS